MGWSLVAAAATQGSTFLINVVLSNLLGRSVFGEYAMVYSTLLTVSILSQLATGSTAVRYVAEYRATSPARAGRVLGLCARVSSAMASLAALGLALAAPWLAAEVLRAPDLTTSLRLAAGLVFFGVINGYQIGALAGLEAYPALARAGAVSGVLNITTVAVGGRWLGLDGAVAGLLAGAAAQWALLSAAIRREATRQGIPIAAEGAMSEARVIYGFALPQALSGVSTVSAQWLAQAILVRSAGYSQVGLFGAANTLRILVIFVPNILNNVSVSLLSHEKGRGDARRYRKLFWTNLALTAGLAMVGALGVFLFGPWLLRIFGKDFAEGRPVVNLLAAAGVCEALAIALHQVIVSREKIWLSFLLLLFPRDVLYLVLAYTLVGEQQAVGLALAWLGSWAFLLVTLAIAVPAFGLDLRPRAASDQVN